MNHIIGVSSETQAGIAASEVVRRSGDAAGEQTFK